MGALHFRAVAAVNPGPALGAFASKHRHFAMLLAALGFATLAIYSAKGYMDEQLAAERERHVKAPVPMENVIVARRDLRPGDPVNADTMAVRNIPRQYAMHGAVRPAQFDAFEGARLSAPIGAGEQLLTALMAGRESAAFSSRLKPGVRALTIAVDEINSISGMLQPGDRVDLYFSARSPDGRQKAAGETTLPLQQNLLVLATGRHVRAGGDDRPTGARPFTSITVELAPLEAQKLVVAQRGGRLTAVLRNPQDRLVESAASMDLRHLFGPVEPPRRQIIYPQIIVGGAGRLAVRTATASAMAPTVPPTAPPAAAAKVIATSNPAAATITPTAGMNSSVLSPSLQLPPALKADR